MEGGVKEGFADFGCIVFTDFGGVALFFDDIARFRFLDLPKS